MSRLPFVWDYDMTEAEFEAILRGEAQFGRLDRDWAAVRLLEVAPYRDIIRLLGTGRCSWVGPAGARGCVPSAASAGWTFWQRGCRNITWSCCKVCGLIRLIISRCCIRSVAEGDPQIATDERRRGFREYPERRQSFRVSARVPGVRRDLA